VLGSSALVNTHRLARTFPWLLGALIFACGGPPKYDGTYEGPMVTTLTPPPPTYGSPTYDSIITLTEGLKGTAVAGSFDGGGLYAAVAQSVVGVINATIDKNNNLIDLSLNIDDLFQGCAQNLVATGSGSLAKDPSNDKILRLSWTASGSGFCAGTMTQFVLGSPDGGIPSQSP
jgi:hypothetical protein